MPVPLNFAQTAAPEAKLFEQPLSASQLHADNWTQAWNSAEEPLNAVAGFFGLDSLGRAERDEASPVLSPEEANRQFGIGDLKFAKPVREAAAKRLNESKREDMVYAERLGRASDAWDTQAGLIADSVLANLLSPGNITIGIATAGVGTAVEGVQAIRGGMTAVRAARAAQATRAAALAERGSLAVIGTRAAQGAAEGAIGAAALEPFVFENSDRWHVDHTMNDALVNALYGAGAGALFGGLGGFFEARRLAGRGAGPGAASSAAPGPDLPTLPGRDLVPGVQFDVMEQFAPMRQGVTGPPTLTLGADEFRRLQGPEAAIDAAAAARSTGAGEAPQPRPEPHIDPEADAAAAQTAASQMANGQKVDVSPFLERRLFVPGPDGSRDLGYVQTPEARGPVRLSQDVAERYPVDAATAADIAGAHDLVRPGQDGSMLLIKSADGTYAEVARAAGLPYLDVLSTGKIVNGIPDRPLVGGFALDELQAARVRNMKEMIDRQKRPESDALYEAPEPNVKPDADAALRGETTAEAAQAHLDDADATLRQMVDEGRITEAEYKALSENSEGIENAAGEADAFLSGASCFTREI